MDIGDDERYRVRTCILDPVRSRAEFGEYLTRTKLLRRSIVMVIGEDPREQVDDRGVALDGCADRYGRPATRPRG